MTPEQIQIFKAMAPADKLKVGLNFCHAARALKSQALKSQHPDWSEEKVQEQVRKIFLYASS